MMNRRFLLPFTIVAGAWMTAGAAEAPKMFPVPGIVEAEDPGVVHDGGLGNLLNP
jgi:hypothetical protein